MAVDGAAKDSRRLSDSGSEGLGLLPAAWRFERIQALRVCAHLNIYALGALGKHGLPGTCKRTETTNSASAQYGKYAGAHQFLSQEAARGLRMRPL